ncbi:Nudix hydrolase 27, chloroplastic [Capsicum baccatum]|uniref:Nudix hydrolase 27, chloroplastic n=1 Tax=Capsicum baccatum TaxID=33114 RepID=A0A2G2VK28_CAPBA|nr:Nudix hydrolase 27, chloroplastic [Capsicum baccatum]
MSRPHLMKNNNAAMKASPRRGRIVDTNAHNRNAPVPESTANLAKFVFSSLALIILVLYVVFVCLEIVQIVFFCGKSGNSGTGEEDLNLEPDFSSLRYLLSYSYTWFLVISYYLQLEFIAVYYDMLCCGKDLFSGEGSRVVRIILEIDILWSHRILASVIRLSDNRLLDGSSIGLGSFWFGVLLTRERRESCISFLVSSGHLVVSNYAFDIFDSDTAHWVLKVFVASRLNVTGAWQIPQGVTEDREDSKSAAIRELWGETGITSAEIIAKVPQWLTYDFPLAVKVKVNSLWGGEWHGQAQTRFLMRFTHAEIEINLATGEAEAEFSMWKWAIPEEVIEQAVDYKRPTCEEEVRKMMVAKLLNANQQKGESCACCLHTVLIPYTGIQNFVSSLYMNLSAKICIYRLVI